MLCHHFFQNAHHIYLTQQASRSSRDEKLKGRKDKQMAYAIAESKKEHEFALEKNKCESIDMLKSKFAPTAAWLTKD